MASIARILISLGLALILIGGFLLVLGRLGLPLGRLPGDIHIERENFTCVIPLLTSILLSIVVTVLLNLAVRWLNR